MERVAGEAECLVILDAGDAVSRENHATEKSSIQLRIAGETLLDAMGLLGYAALGLGEGDLLFGGSFIREAAGTAGVPLLSSSVILAETAEPLASEALFIPAGPHRVGIASVVSDGFAGFVTAHQDPDEPLAVLPTEEALGRALEKLGDASPKILLFHAPYQKIRDLVRVVRGFDIVIGAHESDWTSFCEPRWVEDTAIVQTGWEGRTVGRLDLRLFADGSFEIAGGREITLDSTLPDHPEMVALHEAYLARVAGAIDEILAQHPVVPPPAGTRYVGTAACEPCHETQAAAWRTTKHAVAWRTLADLRRDYDPECYACHTVGFGFEGGFRVPDQTPDREDVGCESCHGAGADHVARPNDPYGTPVGEARCQTCHNPVHSPQFDYATYLPQIQHPQ
ncbi:MAG: hypothetical protein JXP34_20835 [Planctomycetes bacterium]|nr:hypothetical protein [Planctomycetota bacterium]